MLASAAGMVIYSPSVDVDGIDLGIRYPGDRGASASPAIDVQVKTWSTPKQSSGAWRFRGLTEWQFNKLAGSNYTIPRFLFVIIVPSSAEAWLKVTTDGILVRNLAYFCSLSDQPRIESPNRRTRHLVEVPVANVLTANTLRQLVSTGEDQGIRV